MARSQLKPRVSIERYEEAIYAARGYVSLVADMLGLTQPAVYSRIQRSPRLRQAIELARHRELDFAQMKLHEAIERGELSAITFYLRTQGKHLGYGDTLTINVAQLRANIRALAEARGFDPDEIYVEAQALLKEAQRKADE